MDENESYICFNCKREIPAANFTVHSIHCVRNIKVCLICKEPVPQTEMEDHHEKLHKLLPCKQCGESVCGTDLEDHIRDSCAHTMKICRFCELELPRQDLPQHEDYCGTRTEQCSDCHEYVMIKYRQLHIDSNHGFLKLDDDPAPTPPAACALVSSTPTSSHPATRGPRTIVRPINEGEMRRLMANGNDEVKNEASTSSASGARINGAIINAGGMPNVARGNFASRLPPKRTNDQPQVNTSTAIVNKVSNKAIPSSRGAVKKAPAPRVPPTADPRRDAAFFSALKRQQSAERQRREQNAYNMANGLPPVLTAAEKLEKLRKIDALQNRETDDQDYKNCLNGRVWRTPEPYNTGHVLGTAEVHNRAEISRSPSSSADVDSNFSMDHQNNQNRENSMRMKNENGRNNVSSDQNLTDLSYLTPMTPEEFVDRFRHLQMREDGSELDGNRIERKDRFNEIKSSLRELRRGLNEVTAPYNNNGSNSNSNNPRVSPIPSEHVAVQLPCEFCGALVSSDDLVQHQTGCRPDLAQFKPKTPKPRRPLRSATGNRPLPAPVPDPYEVPVIPCEFCTESLPVYLITEHQERCSRENPLMYPD